MTKEELDKIMVMSNAAIVAPAGHGKTEMIGDMVEYSSGRQLILTHTNAGVDAIEKRMQKRDISKERYVVLTIAAFCIKWCVSYPCTATFDITVSPFGKEKINHYYDELYSGTSKIFANQWACSVLFSTYSGVIVDEYQDCTQAQHEIILAINKSLPVRVLGDPLQGIFYWAGSLVDWNALEFPIVEIKTKPWRWEVTNPTLGDFLMDVRTQLLPVLTGDSVQISISACKNCIELIPSNNFNGYSLLPKLSCYSSVLYITKLENQQIHFANHMGGVFQNDETQDCKLLFDFAQCFDQANKSNLALAILDFVKACATNIGTETRSYRSNLENGSWNFSRVRKHPELGHLLIAVCESENLSSISNTLEWFQKQSCFKIYRKELFSEMYRSIKYATANLISVLDAANHIRRDIKLQKRYSQFKYLSSRTVLSKGLEFDCVIVDMRDPLQAKDFYVALTRAKKMVYIISDTNTFTLRP